MASTNCPRCGGQEFHEQNEDYYRDSQLLNEEKNIYKRQLRWVKCDFELFLLCEK